MGALSILLFVQPLIRFGYIYIYTHIIYLEMKLLPPAPSRKNALLLAGEFRQLGASSFPPSFFGERGTR